MSEKDYPNERDCEHGHLRRSCPTCAADSDYAALQARHNALVEAVAWERECDYLWEFGPVLSNIANDELLWSMKSARSEVDRLVANDGDDK